MQGAAALRTIRLLRPGTGALPNITAVKDSIMFSSRHFRGPVAICSGATLAACLVLVSTARAAEPLVWKFAAGDVHHYQMLQNMTMTINMGAGDQVSTIAQDIDMTWAVDSLKADGAAVVTQRINRMQMKINSAGQEMKFDSAAETPMPGPQGALLEPIFKALTSSEFEVTMTPRGEITDVEVPEELIQALQTAPGANKLLGDLGTKEGFKNLVRQGSLALPAKLEDGEIWTTKVEMASPAIGKQSVETTYRYKGPREVEGDTLEVFIPSMEMEFGDGGESGTIEIVKQDSAGEILFNRKAGRMQSSVISQNLDMKVTEAGQQASLKLNHKVELKWVDPEKK